MECPPHWNRSKRTKRTKRTLTGLGRRLRADPNEVLSQVPCTGPGMPMYMSHFAYPISYYSALIKAHVECPPHWNWSKRTKRTLTGIGWRLRVHPNELLFYALCIGNGMPMHMCHLTKPISYYTALIKVKGRVECPPLWNRTKRTKRTLTGLKNRVRANPSELLSHALCIGPGMPM